MAGDFIFGRFDRPVSASALAQLARCECQLLFDLAHGPRRTPVVAAAARRGVRHHDPHYRAVQRFHRCPAPAAADQRCFVASAVCGEAAWQTAVLRRFRDRVLRRHLLGRVLVRG